MAVLENRVTLSLEDLEDNLGVLRLPKFIRDSEKAFVDRTREIAEYVVSQPHVRTIFISGPTSSGKTTFTDRLVTCLSSMGKTAMRMSLDDYYNVEKLRFDDDGRPDYESLTTIDTVMACDNIKSLLAGELTIMPVFDFRLRLRADQMAYPHKSLSGDGYLLVEGLHGLSPDISGLIPHELWVGVFIMPWGEIVSDRRLIGSKRVRLLRRIVRDVRHRGAHALATIDYWPMIESSELNYFSEYLETADFFVNSILTYESLVMAPLALADIQNSLKEYEENLLEPSVFMAKTEPPKAYADLPAALAIARQLEHDLSRIPSIDPRDVPSDSILNEFL